MECEEDNGMETLQMVVTRTPHSQLLWFFVQILQLYLLKLMDIYALIAMAA
jgi:hypothetical protein